MKRLFNYIVRAKLEYASAVWTPYHHKYVDFIQQVQINFLQYLLFRISGEYPRHARHSDLLSGSGYRSLESRRDVCLATTAFKVVRGIYECPQLLDAFGLLAPENYLRARGRDLFQVPVGRTDVIVRHPVTRSIGMLNFVHRANDVISMSLYEFSIFQKCL